MWILKTIPMVVFYSAIPTTTTVQHRLAFFHRNVKHPLKTQQQKSQEPTRWLQKAKSLLFCVCVCARARVCASLHACVRACMRVSCTVGIWVPKSTAGSMEDFVHCTKQICRHYQTMAQVLWHKVSASVYIMPKIKLWSGARGAAR